MSRAVPWLLVPALAGALIAACARSAPLRELEHPSAGAPPAPPELDLPASLTEPPVGAAPVAVDLQVPVDPPGIAPASAEGDVPAEVAEPPPPPEAEPEPVAAAPAGESSQAPVEPSAPPVEGQATPAGEEAVDPQAAAQAEILARLEQYYRAFSSRDWTAMAEHFWPAAPVTEKVTPEGEAAARVVSLRIEAFLERAQRVEQAGNGGGRRQIFKSRMVHPEVRVAGDLAQVWSRFEASSQEPGETVSWRGYDAFTLLRVGGQWKIASLVLSDHHE